MQDENEGYVETTKTGDIGRTWIHLEIREKLPDEGPWQNEPDKMQWVDDVTGLDCLIVRNRIGALCGYVGLPEGHPFYKVSYDDVPADVHGGLTYSDKCFGPICHIPEEGRPDDVWWIGFDCAHAADLTPAMPYTTVFPSNIHETYRDFQYVMEEVRHLATQVAE